MVQSKLRDRLMTASNKKVKAVIHGLNQDLGGTRVFDHNDYSHVKTCTEFIQELYANNVEFLYVYDGDTITLKEFDFEMSDPEKEIWERVLKYAKVIDA